MRAGAVKDVQRRLCSDGKQRALKSPRCVAGSVWTISRSSKEPCAFGKGRNTDCAAQAEPLRVLLDLSKDSA
jgi:hypothetical protein